MEQATSIDKALDLLFHLHASGAAAGVSEIGRALDVPKSSAHRLLAALGRRGLVERDERGRWRPGLALVTLGLGVLDQDPIVRVARPVLEQASRASGETVFLTAARRGAIRVLDKAEGRSMLRVAPEIGSEIPAATTAVGKLQRAFAPEQLSGAGARDGDRRSKSARAIAEAHERGVAWNVEEWIPGLVAVAAPVFRSGLLAGAVVLGLPAARFRSSEARKWERFVTTAARRVTESFELSS